MFIDHTVQVSLCAFKSLVDAVGGVNVPFAYPTKDEETGLDIETPGCVTLDGDEALAYVRSRAHYQYFDGKSWKFDGTSDYGRIARQQDFIQRALQKAVDKGARNVGVARDLLDVALANVVVDQNLTINDLLRLASTLRDFDPAQLRAHSYRVEGRGVTPGRPGRDHPRHRGADDQGHPRGVPRPRPPVGRGPGRRHHDDGAGPDGRRRRRRPRRRRPRRWPRPRRRRGRRPRSHRPRARRRRCPWSTWPRTRSASRRPTTRPAAEHRRPRHCPSAERVGAAEAPLRLGQFGEGVGHVARAADRHQPGADGGGQHLGLGAVALGRHHPELVEAGPPPRSRRPAPSPGSPTAGRRCAGRRGTGRAAAWAARRARARSVVPWPRSTRRSFTICSAARGAPGSWPRSRPTRTPARCGRPAPARPPPPPPPRRWPAAARSSSRCGRRAGTAPCPACTQPRTRSSSGSGGGAAGAGDGQRVEAGVEVEVAAVGPVRHAAAPCPRPGAGPGRCGPGRPPAGRPAAGPAPAAARRWRRRGRPAAPSASSGSSARASSKATSSSSPTSGEMSSKCSWRASSGARSCGDRPPGWPPRPPPLP